MLTNEDMTQKRDGSSKPDTDINTTNNTNTNKNDENTSNKNNTSDPQDKVDGSETSQPKKPISEARRRANRENAQKSTGPKTSRGKAYSRRNALKHGLLVKQVLFAEDGKPINEELHQLWESLHEQYGSDVRTDLLIEGLVVDYWRQRQAMVVERLCFKLDDWHFSPKGNMPNVQRYRTASQRAMLKNLELLDQQPPPQSEADEDEGEAPTTQPENPASALEPSSGLTVVAAEQGSPERGSQSENEAEDSTPSGEVEEAA